MISYKSLLVTGVIYFFFKFLALFYFSSVLECNHPDRKLGNIAASSGDTFSYTGAMENFISTGNYFFINENNEKIEAGRLPHYSVPYFAFRQVLGVKDSYDLVVFFQILVETLATIYFCLFIGKLLSNHLYYYLSLLLFLVNYYTSHFSLFASPESFSVSFLLLFFVAFYEFSLTEKKRYLFLSSFFLALVCVLKPYFLPIYLFFVLDHIFKHGKKKFDKLFFKSLFVSIPLLIMLLPWGIRNYFIEKKFIPLQQDVYAGYFYSESDIKLRQLISAWGESYIFWEKTSAGCFFYLGEKNCDFTLNADLLEVYKKEDLLQLGEGIQDLRIKYNIERDKALVRKIENLIHSYRSKRPFKYYLESRIKLATTFLFHNGTYYLPFSLDTQCFSIFQLSLKIIQAALYWAVLLFGLFGLILLSFKSRVGYYLLFIPFYLIILFPLIFKSVEWRYFHHAFPFLSVGIFMWVKKIDCFLKKREIYGNNLLNE